MSNLSGALLESLVRVEALPASRKIVAIEMQIDGVWRVCGAGQSGIDGVAEVSIEADPRSAIYAVAIDEWGLDWAANLAVSTGQTIRPSNFVGWLYRVTQGGTLASTEPQWWNNDTVGPKPAGTAMLEAVRYYQPVAHGPLSLEFAGAVDPNWAQVVSLLNFDAANNSTTFIDEKGRPWTTSGGAKISTDQAKIGTASAFFNGTSAYITTPNSADFAFGSGNFTIECWVYMAAADTGTNQELISYWNSSSGWAWELYINGAGTTAVFNINGGALLGGSIPTFVGGWHHIAVTREGSTFRLFVDGVLKHSASNSSPINATGTALKIGAVASPNVWFFKGYIDAVRITKGVARYVAAFAPPVEPFPVF